MIHWVSGFKRSGTSMMMGALGAGGMKLKYSRDRDKHIIDRFSDADYAINEDLFELVPDQYRSPLLRQHCEGHLVKLIGKLVLEKANPGESVIYMLRDYEEVDASHEAALGVPLPLTRDQFERARLSIIVGLKEKSCNVLPIWYRGVVQSPLYHFRLIEAFGWPIDPEKAADTVRPELCRFAA